MGEIYINIPYDGIGGVNLMADGDARMDGSGEVSTGGHIRISYDLMTGIVGSGSWSYLFDNNEKISANDIVDRINNGEIEVNDLENGITNLVFRLLMGQIPNYSWDDFRNEYGSGCLNITG